MSHSEWRGIGWALLALAAVHPCPAADLLVPEMLVAELSSLGSRAPGTAGHRAAQEALSRAMSAAGLERVERQRAIAGESWIHLTGALPGEGGRQILITAHYDTLAGTSGALDNASGCATVMSAVGDLSRTPRRRGIFVALTDGEESAAAGSRAWLSAWPPARLSQVVANLDVDMVGDRPGQAGVVHLLVGRADSARLITPAWLVDAALRGARARGLELVVSDRRWSWWAQLAVRCSLPNRVSDGRRFLEVGIPAVTLSDLSLTDRRPVPDDHRNELRSVDARRLELWAQALASIVHRLDVVPDQSIWETEYLVIAGRVWVRRDLVWSGFAIWVLLVWRALPGRWRGRSAAERQRQASGYLPGFAFRMCFLLSVFLVPTFASLLLYPTAVSALRIGRQFPRAAEVLKLVAVAPAAGFVLWLAFGQAAGWWVIERGALLPGTLVLATQVTFWCSQE